MSTPRPQRIAARVAARERERSERERDEAMAALAEQEPADPRARRAGLRVRAAGRDQAREETTRRRVVPRVVSRKRRKAPESRGCPMPPRARARGPASDAPFGAEAERREQRRVPSWPRRATARVADDEARRDVSGVRAEADAREYRRRRDDQSRRVHIRRMVAEEAEKSRSAETEIDEGWEAIRASAANEPLALRDALASLRVRCDASVASKDEAAAFIVAELDRREEASRRACGGRAATSTSCCAHARARQGAAGTNAAGAGDGGERLGGAASELLEKNEREMRSFFRSARAPSAPLPSAPPRASRVRRRSRRRRADDAEEFGILKTRLETDVANLEQHLAHMRAVYQLNAEKLEYNYRVLVEREAENQSTSSQQRKKIAFAREKLMVLKRNTPRRRRRSARKT